MTHLEVNVGEDQLLVWGVDDGGSVGAHEHVRRRLGSKLPEHCGLGAQCNLSFVYEGALRGEEEIEQGPVPQGAEEVVDSLESSKKDGSRNDLPADVLSGDLFQWGDLQQPVKLIY